jgi:hypothetical protein
MIKSATLISAALLSFGLTAASIAADMPKSAAPMAADSGSAAAPAAKSHKHSGSKKRKKSHASSGTAK